MPTTDMNSPSRFKRFLSPPLNWSFDDIESQQSQQPDIHSFQDPSRVHHSTNHPRYRNSSRYDEIETPYSSSSYTVEDHDIQDPSTQSFTQNPRQTLTNMPTRRPRSTSNPELQFSIPGGFMQEDYPKNQSGSQDSYSIPRRRREDREIDLEGRYPWTQPPRNHVEYDLDNSFADRYRRASDTHDQNSNPYFEHRVNESQSPYSNTQDAHQNTNPEPTSASTQRPRRRIHSENESSPAEPLFNSREYTIDDIESQRFRAPKPPAIPIDLDFSGVIQTLRRPIDYLGVNKEETKEMWQCVPNEDLEEGMLSKGEGKGSEVEIGGVEEGVGVYRLG
ncbi:hypothetical protein BGAL_0075g00200 [Botrytis galanthina]|uniref:Uncharacterized protein n=1 Tax=Botrytis galanthina TaxID=278940 RepID=A0A4S8RGA5_9HELO|nr:hypothetical protein BGAL_0075g00200 [Botrytis galanthina]